MPDFGEDTSEDLSIDVLACRLKQIEKDLKRNLSNLHRQLAEIESKRELFSRLTIFEKNMEVQASDLEAEVKRLREDIKTIKELLGVNLKNKNI
jgi:predicted  nucleic acid-binding Zn-ribbon protein